MSFLILLGSDSDSTNVLQSLFDETFFKIFLMCTRDQAEPNSTQVSEGLSICCELSRLQIYVTDRVMNTTDKNKPILLFKVHF